MKVYSFNKQHLLPIEIQEAWIFFSDAENLGLITPKSLSFQIIEPRENLKIHAGQIINYTLKPLFGLSVRWTTEITHCFEESYFVDEQRFGPYKFWHHLHQFQAHERGTLMTDVVHYALPFGLFGEVMNKLIIRNKINQIFDFRSQKLNELFGDK